MSNILILASNNEHKVTELKEKLKAFGIEVLSQKEAGIDIEVDETGTTFKENAILKAEAIYNLSKKPTIADDSGLEVDYLNGQPGIYSHRFAQTDSERISKMLDLLKDVPEEKRTARFKCAICYIDANGEKHIFEQSCEGKIGFTPEGSNGFGFDPIFIHDGKTFAQRTGEEKNKVSHRGKAVAEFIKYLENHNK